MEAITTLLQEGVKKGDFPGASYAIVFRDGFVDTDDVGYKQLLPEKVLLEKDTIYDCASLTKVISTTTMVFKLIEAGLLSLDTSVASVLPCFKHQAIKVKHLLTHSSGLRADIPRAKTLVDKDDVIKRMLALDLQYGVGEHVVYSDIGYILLGLMIEKITQKTLAQYAKEVIFDPLDMRDTSYHPDPNRTAPTEFRDDDVFRGLLKGKVHDEKAFALGGEAGHAGLFSTVRDLSKFILSFLNNDGQVLRPETVDMLFPVQIEDQPHQGVSLVRSLGWNKPTKGGTAGDFASVEDTILHTGFTGCNLWIERQRGIGFVMLSNAVHPKRENNNIIKYRRLIANIILSDKEAKKQ